MCTVLLPQGDNPFALNKYINNILFLVFPASDPTQLAGQHSYTAITQI